MQCGGCTLTQGYWKTHSVNGPAPYNSTWGILENTILFLSGQTWYNVLWTAPAGNPYYNQYMAAYLNGLNGASTPAEASAALAEAQAFLRAYGPDTQWSKAQKGTINRLAGLLDGYNNGLIGPGHCFE